MTLIITTIGNQEAGDPKIIHDVHNNIEWIKSADYRDGEVVLTIKYKSDTKEYASLRDQNGELEIIINPELDDIVITQ